MKKTLIALMALAGVACGATAITGSNMDSLTLPKGGDFWADPFEFTFAISGDISGDYDIVGLYCGDRTGGSWNFNCFVLNNGENGITLSLDRVKTVDNYDSVNNDTTYNGSSADSKTPENSSTFVTSSGTAVTLQKNVEYTVKYLGGANKDDGKGIPGASANLYLGEELVGSFSGGSFNLSGGGTNGVNAMIWQSNEAYITSITINGKTTVPEPATATLSLLALAGLCARRRRA